MTAQTIDLFDALSRLAMAGAFGAVVGLERELRGQLTGMRTNALVAAGSALFTIVGAYGFTDIAPGPNVDPMRVAAQIVSGIGFIGAGAILRDGGSVRGVTTAAALWTSAALGMAAGAGQYLAGAAGVIVILATLIGLRTVRDHGVRRLGGRLQHVAITYERGHGTLGPIVAALEGAGGTVQRLKIDDHDHSRLVSLVVKARPGEALRSSVRDIAKLPEVSGVEIGDAT